MLHYDKNIIDILIYCDYMELTRLKIATYKYGEKKWLLKKIIFKIFS